MKISYLENITANTMWKNELNEFSAIYDKCFLETKPLTIKIKKKEDAFKEGLAKGLPYLEAAKGMGLVQI